jgi:ESCRT-I complex subunit TSG101
MSPSRTDFVPGQSIRQQSLPPPLHSGMTQNEFYGQAQGYEHGRIASPGPALVPQPRTAPRPPIRDLMADDDDDLTPSVSTSTVEASGSIPPSRPLPPATLHLHSLVLSHLSSQYTPLMEHLNSQTSQLLNIQADLSSGEPAIKDEMARLEAVRDVCVSVADKVGGVVVAAEERVRDLERRGEVGVDEVVCSISIVHNQ